MTESPALSLLLQAALQATAKRVAFIHATAHPLLLTLAQQADTLLLSQTFKPDIITLEALGLATSVIQGQFDLILLIPSKDKKQTLGQMAQAFTYLTAQGQLMIACENQYGAKSYESALKKLAGWVGSTSKSKCRLFSAKKTDALNVGLQQQWLAEAKPHIIESHGLWAQAGLFSWKKADVGSQLLLQHLPVLHGKVMDLCCGYGLLAAHIIQQSDDISALHLVEAEGLALDCAVKNMRGFSNLTAYHLDAKHELLAKHMDVVVCNPPFHTGQTRDVALGQSIVSKACGALTHGGELFLVANRQLPYEQILNTHLRSFECIAVGDGFKVIRGRK